MASSSYWGRAKFSKENIRLIRAYGAIPLVYWSPWDKPYEQSRKPDRFNLDAILAGKWDQYIDFWADEAKKFLTSLFCSLGIGNEWIMVSLVWILLW